MGKKKEDPAPAGAPAWMATFSDLMNLLLCFFVLLFSMSSTNEEKFEEVIASIQSSFSIFSAGGKAIGDGTMISSGISQLEMFDDYFKSVHDGDDTEYIGISTNRWSHDKATGYKLYRIGFYDYNVNRRDLDPFIATWGYKDDYFKPYDVDYIKKYYIERQIGIGTKTYVEFIAMVPHDKQTEFTKAFNIIERLYTALKQEITQLTPVYSIGADFRGTSTINEMTDLLYKAFGMDSNFFKYKNEDFYHFVEDEN